MERSLLPCPYISQDLLFSLQDYVLSPVKLLKKKNIYIYIYIYMYVCFLCVCELCLERPHGLLLRRVPCRVECSFAAVLKSVFSLRGSSLSFCSEL